MRPATPDTLVIVEPPDWMDEQERRIREDIIFDMVAATKRRGAVPLVIADLLARYLEGEFDDAQLVAEFDKAYRSRCH